MMWAMRLDPLPFLRKLRKALRIAFLGLLGGIAVICLGLLAIYIVLRLTTLHPISAEVEIKERQATVKLTFDYIDGPIGIVDENNSGRFLTVTFPRARISHRLCGYDWAHYGRTGIYVIPGENLAVLGVGGCDYLVSRHPLDISRMGRVTSDDWVYLGAFDWASRILPTRGAQIGGRHRVFRFIPAAEQGECIIDGSPPSWAARLSARRPSCPSLPEEVILD
jgi:hypothetical protein